MARLGAGSGWIMLAVLPATLAAGQAKGDGRAAAHLPPSPAMTATVRPGAEIFREIDDPGTGNRWLLERDPDHPGGPGRMVLAAPGVSGGAGSARATAQAARTPLLPVIRAGVGDRCGGLRRLAERGVRFLQQPRGRTRDLRTHGGHGV